MIAPPIPVTRSAIALRSRRPGLSSIQMMGASAAIVVRHQPTSTSRPRAGVARPSGGPSAIVVIVSR